MLHINCILGPWLTFTDYISHFLVTQWLPLNKPPKRSRHTDITHVVGRPGTTAEPESVEGPWNLLECVHSEETEHSRRFKKVEIYYLLILQLPFN